MKNDKLVYASKYKTARFNLLLVFLFTVVNIILSAADTGYYFLFSASIPQVILFIFFDSMLVIGVVAAIIFALPYFICYLLGKKYRVVMLISLILFSLDTLFLLYSLALSFDLTLIIDLAFHAWVLYSMIIGTIAWSKLQGENIDDLSANLQEALGPDTYVPNQYTLEPDDSEQPVAFRQITVARKKSFVGSLIKSNIYIDGNLIASLKNGETFNYTANNRKHNVCAAMKGVGNDVNSNIIDIEPSENDVLITLSLKMKASSTDIILTRES